jgi:hypothetical protein
MTVHFVSGIDEVLSLALQPSPIQTRTPMPVEEIQETVQ